MKLREDARMHTVELMDALLGVAEKLGYQIRQEWLGGTGGGKCEFGGRRFIFVDLALSVVEQQEQIASALRDDPALNTIPLSVPLRRALGIRRAA